LTPTVKRKRGSTEYAYSCAHVRKPRKKKGARVLSVVRRKKRAASFRSRRKKKKKERESLEALHEMPRCRERGNRRPLGGKPLPLILGKPAIRRCRSLERKEGKEASLLSLFRKEGKYARPSPVSAITQGKNPCVARDLKGGDLSSVIPYKGRQKGEPVSTRTE